MASETGDVSRSRFARLEAVIDAVLDQPQRARDSVLREACGDDASLLHHATAMLVAMDASAGYLERAADDEAGHLPAAMRAGPWRLVRRIGRGGMGDVWLGERDDGRFAQQVAVKLMRHVSDEDVPRFLREQRTLARLEHPGIARLLDAGTTNDGRPYMAMQYVDGITITDHCRDHALPVDARLHLFMAVCAAVAYAHSHLIVHRDLKPANILVRNDGSVALLDFGIARMMDESETLTQTRGGAMTPRYAAPEQLSGGTQTTQTDVYALGLLLFELLTDRLPWSHLVGPASLAAVQRALAGAPPLASSVVDATRRARLRGDLDAIIGKALRPEPHARYATVDALREDIERHLAHAAVAARGDALGYRLRRGLRRHWLGASLSLLFVSSLLIALGAVSVAQREAARERDIAQTEAKRSKAVRDYLAHMFRDARHEAGAGEPLSAKQVLDKAAARVDDGFASDPAAAAEVLRALGELHFYIDDYAGAAPLLQRWLAHEAAIADPVAAADVRFTLAETLHRMGRSEEAEALLAKAQAFWTTDTARHAEVLLVSRMLQSQLERQRGDVARGITTLEAALPLRLARSGRAHFETAVLYTNLGAAYIQAGRIDDGIAASQTAMELWISLRMERGNDGLNTRNNLAAAYFRKGDLARAEEAFASALALRREVYGPSAATAALIGNYARVLLKNSKADLALPLIDEALTMARAHAGATSPLALSLSLSRAEGLHGQRRNDDAIKVLDTLAVDAEASLPPLLRVRADVLRSQVEHARGDHPGARVALERARSAAQALGNAADPMRAEIDALARMLAVPAAGDPPPSVGISR